MASSLRTVAVWSAAGAGAVCLLPLLLLVGLSGSKLTDPDSPAQPAFKSSRVPPQHVKWVIRAGSVCDTIVPSVVAAQIEAETGWLTSATESPGPAAQEGSRSLIGLGAAAFGTWGSDDDGNGRATPLDPGDAIMALGRFDCSLAEEVQRLRERGGVSGDHLDLTLAAYHSGLDVVKRSRGMPASDAARDYVREVRSLVPRYETGS